VEHSEEFAWRHEHVVAEPAVCSSVKSFAERASRHYSPGDNGVVHDGLVWFVLEVALPSAGGREVGSGPALHLFQLLLSRTDLHTSLNAIGREWASPLEVPLVVHSLLDFRVATGEVVERLDVRLGPVDGECEVVVLEVETDTWQVDDGLDASATKLLGVANSRALEDERGAAGASADDDQLASLVDRAWGVATTQGLGRDRRNTNGLAVLNEDFIDFSVTLQVKVVILGPGAVDVGMCRIASATCSTRSENCPCIYKVEKEDKYQCHG